MSLAPERQRRHGLLDELAREARAGHGAGAPQRCDWAIAEIDATVSKPSDSGYQEVVSARHTLEGKTAQLAAATRRLVVATWVLFAITVALVHVWAYEVMGHY